MDDSLRMDQKNPSRRTLHYYWRELKRYKRYLLPILLLQPVTIFLNSFAGLWILSDVINRLTTTAIPADQLLPTFMWHILGFAACAILGELVLWRLVTYLAWIMSDSVVYDLNRRTFDELSEQSMEFHNNRFGGSLVSQTNKFTGAFARLLDMCLFNLGPALYSFIFTFLILGPQLPFFALLLAALSIAFITIAWFSFRSIRQLNVIEAEAQNKVSGQIADSITNMTAVKSYGREQYEKNRFEKLARNSRQIGFSLTRAVVKRDFGFGIVITLLSCAAFIVLIWGNAWFGVQVGTLILAVTYSSQILGNLWGFNGILRQINRSFGDAREMTLILDGQRSVTDAPNAQAMRITKGAVDIEHMTFKHTEAKEEDVLFKDFSLSIPSGQRVGLVGQSGSGKTTLTKLLLRFADVDQGKISIDGQNISQHTQASLRKHIAYVPQEPLLFHRSLRDNIAYAKPSASLAAVRKAARQANALDFIEQLPQGFDTLVGERGVKLSGGQRQRIAIARAILKDAPILILDEATSALDSESEKLIQDALQKLMKGRTSIVIAHRLSTIAKLDRIIVLDNGKIVEDGSHTELLAQNGMYAKLWAHQSGGFIEE